MKREGLVSEFPMEDIAVMGVAELLPHLVRIWVRLLLMIVVTNSIFSLSLSMFVLKEMDCWELMLCSNCK
jgi:lipid A disaccharide synthetase